MGKSIRRISGDLEHDIERDRRAGSVHVTGDVLADIREMCRKDPKLARAVEREKEKVRARAARRNKL
jgi:hypothetical protein